jgi:hypothetical protein
VRKLVSMGLLLVIAAAVWASGRTSDPATQRSAMAALTQPASHSEVAQALDQRRTARETLAAAGQVAQSIAPRPADPWVPDTNSVWGLADAYSARYGLDDPGVLRALIEAESRGNPRIVNRTAREWSVGLLQVNIMGGRGVGHSEAELLDPDVNLALSMPEIAAAYRQARDEGYSGAQLTVRVAALAQRPDPTTLWRYSAAYAAATREGSTATLAKAAGARGALTE